MKRTTYILIGLFVAGFCMLVGGTWYLAGKFSLGSFAFKRREEYVLLFRESK